MKPRRAQPIKRGENASFSPELLAVLKQSTESDPQISNGAPSPLAGDARPYNLD
jgi:hypothetical protein